MKKLFMGTLATLGILALTACGNSNTGTNTTSAETTQAEANENAETTVSESVDNSEAAAEVKTVSAGKLYMATNAEFPPYEYHEGGDIVGIDVDIAKAIAEKLNLELVIEDTAFDSIILQVSSGKVDIGIAGMTVTEDRLKNIDFSNPYTTSKQVVLVKEDSDINSPSDLTDKIIGVQLGTVGDMLAGDASSNIERYSKAVEAAQALSQGKLDAVIIDNEPAKVFANDIEGIKILDEAFAEEEYAIAIKKGNEALTNKINDILAELETEGVLDEIKAQYINAE